MKIHTAIAVALVSGCVGNPFDDEDRDFASADPALTGSWLAPVGDGECAIGLTFRGWSREYIQMLICVPSSTSRIEMDVGSYWTADGTLNLEPDQSSCPDVTGSSLRYGATSETITLALGSGVFVLDRLLSESDLGDAPDDPNRLGQLAEIGCFDASLHFTPRLVQPLP